MGAEADLRCPVCGEPVLETGTYTVEQHRARQERATCPECHAELVRHVDLEYNVWKLEEESPPADEELGFGD
jgi:hypothetical protein